MMQLPPPGWYLHPSVQGPLHYWDGRGWTDGPPPPTPAQRRDAGRATGLLLVAIGVAGLFGLWSMFAMMIPADACTPEKCNNTLIGTAYLLIWIGLPLAGVGGLVGIGVAAKRGQKRTVPASASLIAVVACIALWFVLMLIATPSSMW